MATKLSPDERKTISNAMADKHTSLMRQANTTKLDGVREAFKAEANKLETLINKFNSMELPL